MVPVTKVSLSIAGLVGLTVAAPSNSTYDSVLKRTVYSGEATYYYQDGVAGSCGKVHSDSAYIGALSTYWMDNGLDYCGGEIIITATSGPAAGTTTTILIEDTCESCPKTHVDLSTGAFGKLSDGDYDLGVIDISWYFNFTPK